MLGWFLRIYSFCPAIMDFPININAEIQARIGLECDRIVTPSHNTIEFHFDTTAKFNSAINGAVGIRDKMARAYMLGFTSYIFRDLEAEANYSSTKDFWAKRPPHRAARSRWGAR